MKKTSKKLASDAARILGASSASRAGLARAAALTPERRKEIARMAAVARHTKRSANTPDADPDIARGRAIDACMLLNDIWHDLRIVDEIAEHFEGPDSTPEHFEDSKAIARVCVHSHVLTLARLREVVDAYAALVPRPLVDEVRHFREEFDRRQVKAYRDQIVGHIHQKSTRRPVDPMDRLLASWKLTKGSAERFHSWIRKKGAPDSEWSVIRFTGRLQKAIMAERKLVAADLGLREAPTRPA